MIQGSDSLITIRANAGAMKLDPTNVMPTPVKVSAVPWKSLVVGLVLIAVLASWYVHDSRSEAILRPDGKAEVNAPQDQLRLASASIIGGQRSKIRDRWQPTRFQWSWASGDFALGLPSVADSPRRLICLPTLAAVCNFIEQLRLLSRNTLDNRRNCRHNHMLDGSTRHG
jgi:hypothetical protein